MITAAQKEHLLQLTKECAELCLAAQRIRQVCNFQFDQIADDKKKNILILIEESVRNMQGVVAKNAPKLLLDDLHP